MSAPPPPVRSLTASTCVPSASTVWCAPSLLGQRERVRVAVHHDDVRRGERGEALDADVAQSAGADHRAGGAGVQQRDHLAHGVVGRDAGVGQGRDVLGSGGLRVELHAGPRGGQQVLRHAARRCRPDPGTSCGRSACPARPGRRGTDRRSASGAGSRCRRRPRWSPRSRPRAPSPRSRGRSCRAGSGASRSSHWPRMMCRSVRQTPAPPTLTTTSSGPVTVGSSTSSTVGCWWYSCNRTAFIGPPPIRCARRFRSGAATSRRRCCRWPRD